MPTRKPRFMTAFLPPLLLAASLVFGGQAFADAGLGGILCPEPGRSGEAARGGEGLGAGKAHAASGESQDSSGDSRGGPSAGLPAAGAGSLSSVPQSCADSVFSFGPGPAPLGPAAPGYALGLPSSAGFGPARPLALGDAGALADTTISASQATDLTGTTSADTATVSGAGTVMSGDIDFSQGGDDSVTISAGAAVSGDIKLGAGSSTVSVSGAFTGGLESAPGASGSTTLRFIHGTQASSPSSLAFGAGDAEVSIAGKSGGASLLEAVTLPGITGAGTNRRLLLCNEAVQASGTPGCSTSTGGNYGFRAALNFAADSGGFTGIGIGNKASTVRSSLAVMRTMDVNLAAELNNMDFVSDGAAGDELSFSAPVTLQAFSATGSGASLAKTGTLFELDLDSAGGGSSDTLVFNSAATLGTGSASTAAFTVKAAGTGTLAQGATVTVGKTHTSSGVTSLALWDGASAAAATTISLNGQVLTLSSGTAGSDSLTPWILTAGAPPPSALIEAVTVTALTGDIDRSASLAGSYVTVSGGGIWSGNFTASSSAVKDTIVLSAGMRATGEWNLGGGANEIRRSPGSSLVRVEAAGLVTLGAGNDTIGGVALSSAESRLDLTGGVILGDGNNIMRVSSAGSAGLAVDAVTGGAGPDTVEVSGAVTGSVNLGGGRNTLVAESLSGSYTGLSGKDDVTVSADSGGDAGSSWGFGGGDDTLVIGSGAEVLADVAMGAGVDRVRGSGAVRGALSFGSGTNVIGKFGALGASDPANQLDLGAVTFGGGVNLLAALSATSVTGTDGLDVVVLQPKSSFELGHLSLGAGVTNVVIISGRPGDPSGRTATLALSGTTAADRIEICNSNAYLEAGAYSCFETEGSGEGRAFSAVLDATGDGGRGGGFVQITNLPSFTRSDLTVKGHVALSSPSELGNLLVKADGVAGDSLSFAAATEIKAPFSSPGSLETTAGTLFQLDLDPLASGGAMSDMLVFEANPASGAGLTKTPVIEIVGKPGVAPEGSRVTIARVKVGLSNVTGLSLLNTAPNSATRVFLGGQFWTLGSDTTAEPGYTTYTLTAGGAVSETFDSVEITSATGDVVRVSEGKGSSALISGSGTWAGDFTAAPGGFGDNVTIAAGSSASGAWNLGGGLNSIRRGSGAGIATVSGRVALGSGDDEIGGLTVSSGSSGLAMTGGVDLGDGTNTMRVSRAGFPGLSGNAVTGGSGFDTVEASGAVTGDVDLGGGRNILSALSLSGSYTGGAGRDTVSVSSASGGDAGSSWSFRAGADELVLSSGAVVSAAVDMGSGDNVVRGRGSFAAALSFGAGDDTIGNFGALAPASDNLVSASGPVDLGDGVNMARLVSAGAVTGGSGADMVEISAAGGSGTVDLEGGANTLVMRAPQASAWSGNYGSCSGSGASRTCGGAGRDQVTFGTNVTASGTLYLGGGFNTLTALGSFGASIEAGAGADTVTISGSGGGGAIDLGDGTNTLTIGGDFSGSVTLGGGNDTVTISGSGGSGTIDLGGGFINQLTIGGGFSGSVTASGTSSSIVTISGMGGSGDIDLGSLHNIVNVSAPSPSTWSGAFGTCSGTGSARTCSSLALGDQLTIGKNVTASGGIYLDGADTLNVAGTISGTLEVGNLPLITLVGGGSISSAFSLPSVGMTIIGEGSVSGAVTGGSGHDRVLLVPTGPLSVTNLDMGGSNLGGVITNNALVVAGQPGDPSGRQATLSLSAAAATGSDFDQVFLCPHGAVFYRGFYSDSADFTGNTAACALSTGKVQRTYNVVLDASGTGGNKYEQALIDTGFVATDVPTNSDNSDIVDTGPRLQSVVTVKGVVTLRGYGLATSPLDPNIKYTSINNLQDLRLAGDGAAGDSLVIHGAKLYNSEGINTLYTLPTVLIRDPILSGPGVGTEGTLFELDVGIKSDGSGASDSLDFRESVRLGGFGSTKVITVWPKPVASSNTAAGTAKLTLVKAHNDSGVTGIRVLGGPQGFMNSGGLRFNGKWWRLGTPTEASNVKTYFLEPVAATSLTTGATHVAAGTGMKAASVASGASWTGNYTGNAAGDIIVMNSGSRASSSTWTLNTGPTAIMGSGTIQSTTTLTFGDQDDTIGNFASWAQASDSMMTIQGAINLGGGSNSVKMPTASANITAGGGDDRVELTNAGGTAVLNLGGGSNSLKLDAPAASTWSGAYGSSCTSTNSAYTCAGGGSGADEVTIGANVTVGANAHINLGGGRDVLTVAGTLNAPVNLGGGGARVTLRPNSSGILVTPGRLPLRLRSSVTLPDSGGDTINLLAGGAITSDITLGSPGGEVEGMKRIIGQGTITGALVGGGGADAVLIRPTGPLSIPKLNLGGSSHLNRNLVVVEGMAEDPAGRQVTLSLSGATSGQASYVALCANGISSSESIASFNPVNNAGFLGTVPACIYSSERGDKNGAFNVVLDASGTGGNKFNGVLVETGSVAGRMSILTIKGTVELRSFGRPTDGGGISQGTRVGMINLRLAGDGVAGDTLVIHGVRNLLSETPYSGEETFQNAIIRDPVLTGPDAGSGGTLFELDVVVNGTVAADKVDFRESAFLGGRAIPTISLKIAPGSGAPEANAKLALVKRRAGNQIAGIRFLGVDESLGAARLSGQWWDLVEERDPATCAPVNDSIPATCVITHSIEHMPVTAISGGSADQTFATGTRRAHVRISGDWQGAYTSGALGEIVTLEPGSGSVTIGAPQGAQSVAWDMTAAPAVIFGTGAFGSTVDFRFGDGADIIGNPDPAAPDSERMISISAPLDLGGGDNIVNILSATPSIAAGAGDDQVEFSSMVGRSDINLGGGENTLVVGASAAGQAWTGSYGSCQTSGGATSCGGGGSGGDHVTIGAGLAASASIHLGEGANTLTVHGGFSGFLEAGAGDDTVIVAAGMDSSLESVNLGSGENALYIVGKRGGPGDTAISMGLAGGPAVGATTDSLYLCNEGASAADSGGCGKEALAEGDERSGDYAYSAALDARAGDTWETISIGNEPSSAQSALSVSGRVELDSAKLGNFLLKANGKAGDSVVFAGPVAIMPPDAPGQEAPGATLQVDFDLDRQAADTLHFPAAAKNMPGQAGLTATPTVEIVAVGHRTAPAGLENAVRIAEIHTLSDIKSVRIKGALEENGIATISLNGQQFSIIQTAASATTIELAIAAREVFLKRAAIFATTADYSSTVPTNATVAGTESWSGDYGTAGNFTDSVTIEAGMDATGEWNLGGGDNSVKRSAEGDDVSIISGNLTMGGGQDVIGGQAAADGESLLELGAVDLGGGDNSLVAVSAMSVEAGAGDDRVELSGLKEGAGDFSLGGGANSLVLETRDAVTWSGGYGDCQTGDSGKTCAGGDGPDSVTIGAGVTASGPLSLGGGNDTATVRGTLSAALDLGAGADSLALEGGSVAGLDIGGYDPGGKTISGKGEISEVRAESGLDMPRDTIRVRASGELALGAIRLREGSLANPNILAIEGAAGDPAERGVTAALDGGLEDAIDYVALCAYGLQTDAATVTLGVEGAAPVCAPATEDGAGQAFRATLDATSGSGFDGVLVSAPGEGEFQSMLTVKGIVELRSFGSPRLGGSEMPGDIRLDRFRLAGDGNPGDALVIHGAESFSDGGESAGAASLTMVDPALEGLGAGAGGTLFELDVKTDGEARADTLEFRASVRLSEGSSRTPVVMLSPLQTTSAPNGGARIDIVKAHEGSGVEGVRILGGIGLTGATLMNGTWWEVGDPEAESGVSTYFLRQIPVAVITADSPDQAPGQAAGRLAVAEITESWGNSYTGGAGIDLVSVAEGAVFSGEMRLGAGDDRLIGAGEAAADPGAGKNPLVDMGPGDDTVGDLAAAQGELALGGTLMLGSGSNAARILRASNVEGGFGPDRVEMTDARGGGIVNLKGGANTLALDAPQRGAWSGGYGNCRPGGAGQGEAICSSGGQSADSVAIGANVAYSGPVHLGGGANELIVRGGMTGRVDAGDGGDRVAIAAGLGTDLARISLGAGENRLYVWGSPGGGEVSLSLSDGPATAQDDEILICGEGLGADGECMEDPAAQDYFYALTLDASGTRGNTWESVRIENQPSSARSSLTVKGEVIMQSARLENLLLAADGAAGDSLTFDGPKAIRRSAPASGTPGALFQLDLDPALGDSDALVFSGGAVDIAAHAGPDGILDVEVVAAGLGSAAKDTSAVIVRADAAASIGGVALRGSTTYTETIASAGSPVEEEVTTIFLNGQEWELRLGGAKWNPGDPVPASGLAEFALVARMLEINAWNASGDETPCGACVFTSETPGGYESRITTRARVSAADGLGGDGRGWAGDYTSGAGAYPDEISIDAGMAASGDWDLGGGRNVVERSPLGGSALATVHGAVSMGPHDDRVGGDSLDDPRSLLAMAGGVDLGDGNNTMRARSAGSPLAASPAAIAGGSSGTDIVEIGGAVIGNVNMRGGENRFSAASISGRYTGGPGIDRVALGGAVTGAIDLGGWDPQSPASSDNWLVAGRLSDGASVFNGTGAGMDTVEILGGAAAGSSVDLGGGTNALRLLGAPFGGAYAGGAGADLISGDARVASAMRLGGGDDRVGIDPGGPDGDLGTEGDNPSPERLQEANLLSFALLLDLGDGDNSVWALSADDEIRGGSGADRITLSAESAAAIHLGGGANRLSAHSAGAVTGGTGPDTIIIADRAAGVIDLGGDPASASAPAGDNSVAVGILAANIVNGTDRGVDTVSIGQGGNVEISLGDGTNTVSIGRLWVGTFRGGAGRDTLRGEGALSGEAHLGEGDDSVGIDPAGPDGLMETAGDNPGGEEIARANSLSLGGIVRLGGGDNSVWAKGLAGGAGNIAEIIGGSGRDRVFLSGDAGERSRIDLGGGAAGNALVIDGVVEETRVDTSGNTVTAPRAARLDGEVASSSQGTGAEMDHVSIRRGTRTASVDLGGGANTLEILPLSQEDLRRCLDGGGCVESAWEGSYSGGAGHDSIIVGEGAFADLSDPARNLGLDSYRGAGRVAGRIELGDGDSIGGGAGALAENALALESVALWSGGSAVRAAWATGIRGRDGDDRVYLRPRQPKDNDPELDLGCPGGRELDDCEAHHFLDLGGGENELWILGRRGDPAARGARVVLGGDSSVWGSGDSLFICNEGDGPEGTCADGGEGSHAFNVALDSPGAPLRRVVVGNKESSVQSLLRLSGDIDLVDPELNNIRIAYESHVFLGRGEETAREAGATINVTGVYAIKEPTDLGGYRTGEGGTVFGLAIGRKGSPAADKVVFDGDARAGSGSGTVPFVELGLAACPPDDAGCAVIPPPLDAEIVLVEAHPDSGVSDVSFLLNTGASILACGRDPGTGECRPQGARTFIQDGLEWEVQPPRSRRGMTQYYIRQFVSGEVVQNESRNIDLGAGDNQLRISGEWTGNYTGMAGSDDLTLVTGAVASGTLRLGDGVNSISGIGSVSSVEMGGGNDFIGLRSEAVPCNGSDEVAVAPPEAGLRLMGSVTLGGGCNFVRAISAESIIAGDGPDKIALSGDVGRFGASGHVVRLGDARVSEACDPSGPSCEAPANSLTVRGRLFAKVTSVAAGSALDTVEIAGGTGDIDLGGGANTLTVSYPASPGAPAPGLADGEWSGDYRGLGGVDTVAAGPGTRLSGALRLGGGDDVLKGSGHAARALMGSGADTVGVPPASLGDLVDFVMEGMEGNGLALGQLDLGGGSNTVVASSVSGAICAGSPKDGQGVCGERDPDDTANYTNRVYLRPGSSFALRLESSPTVGNMLWIAGRAGDPSSRTVTINPGSWDSVTICSERLRAGGGCEDSGDWGGHAFSAIIDSSGARAEISLASEQSSERSRLQVSGDIALPSPRLHDLTVAGNGAARDRITVSGLFEMESGAAMECPPERGPGECLSGAVFELDVAVSGEAASDLLVFGASADVRDGGGPSPVAAILLTPVLAGGGEPAGGAGASLEIARIEAPASGVANPVSGIMILPTGAVAAEPGDSDYSIGGKYLWRLHEESLGGGGKSYQLRFRGDFTMIGDADKGRDVDLGGGANVAKVNTAWAGSYSGGSGDDTLELFAGASMSRLQHLGEGSNVVISGASPGETAVSGVPRVEGGLSFGSGDDTIGGSPGAVSPAERERSRLDLGGEIRLGGGSNAVSARALLAGGSIIGGPGPDVVSMSGEVLGLIDLGAGFAPGSAFIGGALRGSVRSSSAGVGADRDEVEIVALEESQGSAGTVSLGGGDNRLTVSAGSGASPALWSGSYVDGPGGDEIVVGAGAEIASGLSLRLGANVVMGAGTLSGAVVFGAGDDRVGIDPVAGLDGELDTLDDNPSPARLLEANSLSLKGLLDLGGGSNTVRAASAVSLSAGGGDDSVYLAPSSGFAMSSLDLGGGANSLWIFGERVSGAEARVEVPLSGGESGANNSLYVCGHGMGVGGGCSLSGGANNLFAAVLDGRSGNSWDMVHASGGARITVKGAVTLSSAPNPADSENPFPALRAVSVQHDGVAGDTVTVAGVYDFSQAEFNLDVDTDSGVSDIIRFNGAQPWGASRPAASVMLRAIPKRPGAPPLDDEATVTFARADCPAASAQACDVGQINLSIHGGAATVDLEGDKWRVSELVTPGGEKTWFLSRNPDICSIEANDSFDCDSGRQKSLLGDPDLDLGGGENKLTVSGKWIGKYTGRGGPDSITFTVAAESKSLDLGEGDNSVEARSGGDVNGGVFMGGGNDFIRGAGLEIAGEVMLGDGDNRMNVAASGAITGGSGEDFIIVAGDIKCKRMADGNCASVAVDLGGGSESDETGGKNTLTVGGSVEGGILSAASGTGDDRDEVKVADVDGSVNLGGGENDLEVSGEIKGGYKGGAGIDRIVIRDGGLIQGTVDVGLGANVITGNSGAEAITIAAGSGTIDMMGGRNRVSLKGAWDGALKGGPARDEVVFGAGGSASSMDLGEGENTVFIEGAGFSAGGARTLPARTMLSLSGASGASDRLLVCAGTAVPDANAAALSQQCLVSPDNRPFSAELDARNGNGWEEISVVNNSGQIQSELHVRGSLELVNPDFGSARVSLADGAAGDVLTIRGKEIDAEGVKVGYGILVPETRGLREDAGTVFELDFDPPGGKSDKVEFRGAKAMDGDGNYVKTATVALKVAPGGRVDVGNRLDIVSWDADSDIEGVTVEGVDAQGRIVLNNQVWRFAIDRPEAAAGPGVAFLVAAELALRPKAVEHHVFALAGNAADSLRTTISAQLRNPGTLAGGVDSWLEARSGSETREVATDKTQKHDHEFQFINTGVEMFPGLGGDGGSVHTLLVQYGTADSGEGLESSILGIGYSMELREPDGQYLNLSGTRSRIVVENARAGALREFESVGTSAVIESGWHVQRSERLSLLPAARITYLNFDASSVSGGVNGFVKLSGDFGLTANLAQFGGLGGRDHVGNLYGGAAVVRDFVASFKDEEQTEDSVKEETWTRLHGGWSRGFGESGSLFLELSLSASAGGDVSADRQSFTAGYDLEW